ncbi:hypothetical protein HX062_16015 [Myroides sp. DF42-4-2]|nr:hypothetical protein [Myroides sp. DF42-4-2]
MTKHFFLIIILFGGFISCKKDIQKLDEDDESFKFTFKYPDTVYVGESHYCEVLYFSDLDTITTSFDDEIYKRYVYMCMKRTKNINYDFETLKNSVLDTLGALNNREIPIGEIEFSEAGIHYLDGYVVDEVIFTAPIEGKYDNNGEPLYRYITEENRITKKVVVIDKE